MKRAAQTPGVARAPWLPRLLSLVFTASGLCLPLPAAAVEPRSTAKRAEDFLVWQAPAGCSTAAAVRERVSELLGEPELDLRQVERVEGRVQEAPRGWALHLVLVDALGRRERELVSDSCQDLAEAAAVAITLAFEAARSRAGASGEGPGNPPAGSSIAGSPVSGSPVPGSPDHGGPDHDSPAATPPAPGPSPLPSAEPGVPIPSATDTSSARSTPVSLGAELVVDASSLAVVAPGVAVLAMLRWSELRVGAFALWLPPVDKSLGLGQSVEFSLLGAGVRGCYALGHGSVDTLLCAGIEAGALTARGSGLVDARSVSDVWVAPQLGLQLEAALSRRLSLHLRGDVLVPLFRQGYVVNGTDTVDDVSRVGVRGVLGMSLSL